MPQQMPELQLQAGDARGSAAQTFPDPMQADETFREGRPQVRIARKFSIVPAQAGSLRISGPRLQWWDVRAGIVRTASLPDLTVPVAPGANGFGAVPPAAANANVPDANRYWIRVPGRAGAVQPWALAAAVFALLWLVTFMWGLHRRPYAVAADKDAAVVPGVAPHGTLADLRRALDNGDLRLRCTVRDGDAGGGRSGCAACAAGRSGPGRCDRIIAARALGGDGVAARAALRSAFKQGPRWRVAEQKTVEEPLPPLYPR